MNFYLINPDAEHRGILLIKNEIISLNVKLQPVQESILKSNTFLLDNFSPYQQNSNTFLIPIYLIYQKKSYWCRIVIWWVLCGIYWDMFITWQNQNINQKFSHKKIKSQRACKLTRFAFGPKWPYCKDKLKIRIPRKFWMRLIPWTKYYHCNWCGCKYFSILNGVAFRLVWQVWK